jgi:hypothetical protein
MLTWSISDPDNTFKIDRVTGVVEVNDNVDLVFATHPTITATISVSGRTPTSGMTTKVVSRVVQIAVRPRVVQIAVTPQSPTSSAVLLTDDFGNILTDESGHPLTAGNVLTDESGNILTDESGHPLTE